MQALVRGGGTFADALAASEVCDGADLGQLAIGERTGELLAEHFQFVFSCEFGSCRHSLS